MEVGHEAVHNLVAVSGIKEGMGHALLRLYGSIFVGNGFYHAGAGGTHRYNTAASGLRCIDDVGYGVRSVDQACTIKYAGHG